jgi:hypothetical protein
MLFQLRSPFSRKNPGRALMAGDHLVERWFAELTSRLTNV